MGADAVAIGQGVLVALGCNSESYVAGGEHVSAVEDYARLGTAPGFCHHCHTGKCPVGVTTQDPVLELRLEPAVGARRLKNYLKTVNMELTTIARACGKQDVHHLEKEDLVALTVERPPWRECPWRGRPGFRGRQARGGVGERWRPIESPTHSRTSSFRRSSTQVMVVRGTFMKSTKLLGAGALALMGLLAGTATLAASKAEIDASVGTALSKFNAINPSHRELERKAVGILVFPPRHQGRSRGRR